VGEVGAGAGCSSIQAFVSQDLISQVAPTDYRQNNASLFKLARWVRDFESATGRVATKTELKADVAGIAAQNSIATIANIVASLIWSFISLCRCDVESKRRRIQPWQTQRSMSHSTSL
jgi:hypothetical protein